MNYLKMLWNWCFGMNPMKFVKSKTTRKYPTNRCRKTEEPTGMIATLKSYLLRMYDFRYNRLTEETEFRKREVPGSFFVPVSERELNSFCMDARQAGINCWDRDVSRYIHSDKIPEYHPLHLYMDELPEWDGKDRIAELAGRVSEDAVGLMGFHRWLLGLAAQWMGITYVHANSVAPLLVSIEQGKMKSTFCKVLMPEALQRYYTDSYDLSSPTQAEQKLALFGLVNLDEFDKISPAKTALLKNLMQMSGLNIKRAYKKNYSNLSRIASFIGTSNRKDLLTDPTGSRRFLCVEVTRKINCEGIDHPQIYAQLKAEIMQSKAYWFTSEEEAEIMQHNAAFYKQLPEEEVFRSCYRPAGKGEACKTYSGAEIFKRLKTFNSAAMREASPTKFAQVLIKLGVERVHTKYGNCYRVVELR